MNTHTRVIVEHKVLLVLIFLFLLALPMILAGCKGRGKDTTEEKHLMVVEYITPQKQSVVETVMLTGTVRAENRSMVAANTGGKVVDWYVDVGDRVKKGQVLIRLETGALSAQYQQAKAQLNIARQQLDIAKKGARPEEISQLKEQESAALTAFQTTEDNYNRQKKLFEDGAVPQVVLDQALATRDAAKAQLESIRLSLKMAETGARPEDVKIAKLSVEAAQSQVNALGATIGYASVRAPFDGVVNSRDREIGEFAGMGDSLFEVIGDGPRKIIVDVPATLITQLSKASSVIATIGDERREGFIIKTHPAVDEKTRTGVIEIGLTDESGLIVGGFVELEFLSNLATDVLTVPRLCVLDPGDNPYIWVATDSGKVVKTNVVVGATSRHLYEIKSGLNGSEKVLITGMSLVSAEGEYEVRPYDTTQDGAEVVADQNGKNPAPSADEINDEDKSKTGTEEASNEPSESKTDVDNSSEKPETGNDESNSTDSGGSR